MPGDTVLKNERRTEAVHRVADEELGEPVVVDDCLGTCEHFYDTSETDGVDSNHYVATAYRCRFERDEPAIVGDDQHGELHVFRPPFDDAHPYAQRYLDALQSRRDERRATHYSDTDLARPTLPAELSGHEAAALPLARPLRSSSRRQSWETAVCVDISVRSSSVCATADRAPLS